jgi:hypothetical protein
MIKVIVYVNIIPRICHPLHPRDLFKDTCISCVSFVASNNEFGKIYEETVVTYYKVTSKYLP